MIFSKRASAYRKTVVTNQNHAILLLQKLNILLGCVEACINKKKKKRERDGL